MESIVGDGLSKETFEGGRVLFPSPQVEDTHGCFETCVDSQNLEVCYGIERHGETSTLKSTSFQKKREKH